MDSDRDDDDGIEEWDELDPDDNDLWLDEHESYKGVHPLVMDGRNICRIRIL